MTCLSILKMRAISCIKLKGGYFVYLLLLKLVFPLECRNKKTTFWGRRSLWTYLKGYCGKEYDRSEEFLNDKYRGREKMTLS
jgi:hypothetical protein